MYRATDKVKNVCGRMAELKRNLAVPAPLPIGSSPKILKYSPEALDGQDISFEAYKQAKYNTTRKRSFSPIINERNMRSPDISPIELNKNFNMSPRLVTPKANPFRCPSNNARQPPKFPSANSRDRGGKTLPMIGTPLVKRELEHRISVGNILNDLKLSKYISIFTNEEIDFEVFLTLSEKDLHDIGIHCQKDIDMILTKVAEYNGGK